MFLKVGHRGARAYKPENTLKSFEKAIELGVNAIEFDVRQTKDKELVVFHDEKVDRLTSGKGFVKNLTLREIKLLRVDGELIPTLEEALNFIDKKVEKILIELKETGIERKVLKEVEKRRLAERVIIVSFLEDALRKVRQVKKNLEIVLYMSNIPIL